MSEDIYKQRSEEDMTRVKLRRVESDTLQSMFRGVVKGLPIDLKGECHMVASAEATQEQIIEGIKRVLGASTEVTTSSRFCLGDLYNQLSNRYGVKAASIIPEFGKKYYNLLRQYGWIASKWAAVQRDPSLPWSYYRDNEPGGIAKKRQSPEEKLKERLRVAFKAGEDCSFDMINGPNFDEWYEENYARPLQSALADLPKNPTFTPDQEHPGYLHRAGNGSSVINEDADFSAETTSVADACAEAYIEEQGVER
jgi:hypothetical protein